MNSKLLFARFTVIITVLAINPTVILAGQSYAKEIIFETRANMQPLDIPIKLGIANPAPPREDLISAHSSLGTFFIDSKGRLFRINYKDNNILIFDFTKNHYIKFQPDELASRQLRGIWLGPNDEIYIGLILGRQQNSGSPFYGLVKYNWAGGKYIKDEKYDMPTLPNLSIHSISPDNHIYMMDWEAYKAGNEGISDVYDKDGKYIKISRAFFNDANGTEFEISEEKGANIYKILISKASSKTMLHEFESGSRMYFQYLICDLDYDVLLTNHLFEDIKLGAKFLRCDKPKIEILNLNTHAMSEIDTRECGLDNYKYFNVDNVYCNYLGEVYALIVYFNMPGLINGDEIAVLYRWRKR